MNENFDQEIQDALRTNLHSEEPSEELMRKLRVMASETKPRRALWLRPGLAVAGVTAAVAVIAITMLPTQAAAKSYSSLVRAAEQVRRFQFSIVSMDSGGKNALTIAGSDGRIAMRTNEGIIMSFDTKALNIYDPKENVVTRFQLGGLVSPEEIAKQMRKGMAEGMKDVDLKKMLSEYAAKFGKDHIQISAVHNGVYDVNMTSDDPERVHMTVNAATDLPSEILVEKKVGDGWVTGAQIQMRFNDDVDPAMLRADFPANAKKMDLDLGALAGQAMSSVKAITPLIRKFGDPPQGKSK